MTKKLLLVGLLLLAAVAVICAADAVTGKWTYEQPAGRGGMGGGGGAPGGGAPGGGAPGGGAPGGAAPAPRIVTLDLKAAGAALTGTILQPMGGGRGLGGGGGAAPAAPAAPTPVEIKNGKVDGNKISFDVTREGMNGPTTTKYEGVVTGDSMELSITSDRGNGPQTQKVTAKKG